MRETNNPKLPTYMELFQENKELRKEIKKLRDKIVDVPATKGKSGLEIEKEGNVWIVREYRKVNREGKVKKIETKVAHKNVQVLWGIILRHCQDVGDKVKYKELVPTILSTYNLQNKITVEGFNGGSNRSKYFDLYQYPSKILHYLGYTNYSLKGITTRLK